MTNWVGEIKELEKLYESFKGHLPAIVKEMEQLIRTNDPNVVMLYSRRCLEVIITDLSEYELKRPRKTEPLKGIIDKLNREEIVPSHIITSMHSLNSLATYGTHPKDFDPEQVKPVLNNLAIIIRWYMKYKDFQITSKTKDGEQKYKSIEDNDFVKVTQKHSIRSLFIFTSLILLIIIASAIIILNLRGRQIGDITELEKTIAVLPFQNDSPTEENLLYVNSFTDEIRNNLQRINILTVIDRNSSEYINKLSLSSSEKAKKLDVNFLVQGSGFKLGDIFRLRVQLILAAKGTVLWSNSYQIETQEIKELFDVYLQISEEIAKELKAAITPQEKQIIEKVPTKQMDAYEAYLKGQSYWRELTPESLKNALSYFEKAKDIDPNYALAYAGISDVWIGRQQFGIESPEIAGPKAYEAAMKAKSLDSMRAEVHYSLALLYSAVMDDRQSAQRSFKKAIMLKPNYPEARLFYSHLLNFKLGRPDEAKAQAEIGIKQDPANPLILNLYAVDLHSWGQSEDALNIIRKVFEIDPTSILANWTAGGVYFSLGNYNDAFEAFKSAYSLQYKNLSHAFGEITEKTDIFTIFKKEADTLARQRTKSYVLPTDIAMLYAMSGEYNKALDWLEIAFKEEDPNLPGILNPLYDPLGDESRYQELVRKLNIPFSN